MNIVRIVYKPAFLLALVIVISCGEAEKEKAATGKSLKGFEIYSWQEGGEWCYSLLTGTNRMKSREEVTSPEARLHGSTALKEQLERLATGEFVSWVIAGIPGLTMPPENIVDDTRAFCEGRGLKPLF